jgi:hypothetical protein
VPQEGGAKASPKLLRHVMLLSKVYHRGDDAADQQGIDAHHGQNVLGVSLKLLDAAQPGAARVVVLDVVVEGQEGVLRISCSLDGRRRKVDSCCGDRRFALHVVRVIAAGLHLVQRYGQSSVL